MNKPQETLDGLPFVSLDSFVGNSNLTNENRRTSCSRFLFIEDKNLLVLGLEISSDDISHVVAFRNGCLNTDPNKRLEQRSNYN